MIISETLTKIHLNSSRIAKLLKSVNDEITEISSVVCKLNKEKNANYISQLKEENRLLEKQVEEYKQELTKLRIANDVPQISITSQNIGTDTKTKAPESDGRSDLNSEGSDSGASKKTKSVKGQTNTSKKSEEENSPNFGLLDIRVGKIIEVERHPNADLLYVEKVDFGGPPYLTILSALVPFVPIEEMQDRLALFLINLKPQKMRGIVSEGMIMGANQEEKFEFLIPPEGSVPGDIVYVEGYKYQPEPVITPKKNIYETISPHMRINQHKIATFKDIPWNVGGKGPATTNTISNVFIR